MPFALDWMLGVEDEGEHHRVVSDNHRLEKVQQLWRVVRVTAEDRRTGVIQRVHRAVEAQGFECPCNLSSVR
jgi:hypothetical protein